MPLGQEKREYLKLKAAYYCYELDYSQVDAAKRLGISRVTLAKLLKEAREEGVVRIEVIDKRNLKKCFSLEDALRASFDLADARVIEASDADEGSLLGALAATGAEYFESIVANNQRIAIAWGRTLELMMDYLQPDAGVRGLEVVTLMGGSGTMDSVIRPDIIAQRLLSKYSGKGYTINAPYICHTAAVCEAIKQEPNIEDVFRRGRLADVTLVGIGERPALTAQYDRHYQYGKSIISQLIDSEAVGDICANFFRADGALCKTSMQKRIVSIDITELCAHKHVIAVAGGKNKHEAVLGALRGGYLDALITDRATASFALENK